MKKTDQALILAYNAHKGQKRKYTCEPYICHPIAVAALLEAFGYGEDVVSAALLHDVVEDTPVKIEDIREVFGEEIAKLVLEVTDVSKPEDGARPLRKEKDRNHIASASLNGKAIKLADLIDNTKSISLHDKNFAKVYLKEKALLLEVLGNAHSGLLALAKKTLREAEELIK